MSLHHLGSASAVLLRGMSGHAVLHSIQQPMLGVGIHLYPLLPQGILQIIMVALPTIVLPRVSRLLPLERLKKRGKEHLLSLADSVRKVCFSLLPANTKAELVCSKCNKQYRRLIAPPKKLEARLFTVRQVKQMYRLWLQHAEQTDSHVNKRRWRTLWRGRARSPSEEQSNSETISMAGTVTPRPTSPTTPRQGQARVIHRTQLSSNQHQQSEDLLYLSMLHL